MTDVRVPPNFGMERPACDDEIERMQARMDKVIASARGKMTEKALAIESALIMERATTALLRERIIILHDTIATMERTLKLQERLMHTQGIALPPKPAIN